MGRLAAFKWACAAQLKVGSALSVRCISCVHHRGGIQRISGAVHHKRAHSMQQCISQCISIRPARIGSLAPPNCWSNTRTKIPTATTSQKFWHFFQVGKMVRWQQGAIEARRLAARNCFFQHLRVQLFSVALLLFVYPKLRWISSLETINWVEGHVCTLTSCCDLISSSNGQSWFLVALKTLHLIISSQSLSLSLSTCHMLCSAGSVRR